MLNRWNFLKTGFYEGINDDLADVLRDTYRMLTAQYGLQMVILTEDGG